MVDKCKEFAIVIWNSIPIPYSKSKTPISAPVQCPIVYSPDYDITFWGFERCLHTFDSGKWGKVLDQLISSGRLTTVFKPDEVGEDDLRRIHSANYLDSLKDIRQLARILEIPGLFYAKHFRYVYDVGHRILHSLRKQTGGTILAAELALQEKWAINIGGGFHHASGNHGGGFCVYADISIALRKLFDEGHIRKAMIVDLDAHQGNGHEMDFLNNPNVYIVDMFNADIYPRDYAAMEAIKLGVKLESGTGDSEYLSFLRKCLAKALDEFHPDLVIYNAGTDVLAGDPLGRLNISVEGIVERDEIVFNFARHRQIPIAMVTSGGYSMKSAEVIAKSILNLDAKELIELR